MKKECAHEQIHYMGKGPLPESRKDCRWNYVCRSCHVWMKFKKPVALDGDDRPLKALPEPTWISEPNNPALGYGVPKPTPKKRAKAKAKRPIKRKSNSHR